MPVKTLAFQHYLRERFSCLADEEVLRGLLRESGVTAVPVLSEYGSFNSEHSYSEEEYNRLTQLLLERFGEGQSMASLLFEFGQYFIAWLAEKAGFEKILHRVAQTLVDYARSLNRFLEQLLTSLGHTQATMPQVHVTDVTTHAFKLLIVGETSCSRQDFVQGVLDRIATKVFNMSITFEALPSNQVGLTSECQALIRVSSTSPMFPAQAEEEVLSQQAGESSCALPQRHTGLGPEMFYKMFPFHLVLDLEFRVLQAGESLVKMVPQLAPGVQIDSIFMIQSPRVPWSMPFIELLVRDSKVTLGTEDGIKLQGGLYRAPLLHRQGSTLHEGADALIFLLSPHLYNIDDLESRNLYLSDFASHDMTSDYIVVCDDREATMLNLEEERLQNAALTETLQETLAAQAGVAGIHLLGTESAAEASINLLDALILGRDVDIQHVLAVRDAILKAGSNLWAPLDLNAAVEDQDEEVTKSLASLLGASSSVSKDTDAGAGTRGAFEAGIAVQASLFKRQASREPPHHLRARSSVAGVGLDPTLREALMSRGGEPALREALMSRGGGGAGGSGGAGLWGFAVGNGEDDGLAGGSGLMAARSSKYRSISLHARAQPQPGADGGGGVGGGGGGGGSMGGAETQAAAQPQPTTQRFRRTSIVFSQQLSTTFPSSPSPTARGGGDSGATADAGGAGTAAGPAASSSSPELPATAAAVPTLHLTSSPLPVIAGASAADPGPSASPSATTSPPHPSSATPGPGPSSAALRISQLRGSHSQRSFKEQRAPLQRSSAAQLTLDEYGASNGVSSAASVLVAHEPPARRSCGSGLHAALSEHVLLPSLGSKKALHEQHDGHGSPDSGGDGEAPRHDAGAGAGAGREMGPPATAPPLPAMHFKINPLLMPTFMVGKHKPRSTPCSPHSLAMAAGRGMGASSLSAGAEALDATERGSASCDEGGGGGAMWAAARAPAKGALARHDSQHGSGSAVAPGPSANDVADLIKLMAQPSDPLSRVLQGVEQWQFDSFELDRVSGGRPLSCLAFHLIRKMDITKQLQLSETRLCKFLMKIESGYPDNPYHYRVHAADVLRTFHMVLTRGGVMDTVVSRTAALQQQHSSQLSPTPASGGNSGAAQPPAAGAGNNAGSDMESNTCLLRYLACYLAAVIHDYEHKGLNNDFLIRSSDHLALLYNDNSPLENHHISASFMLMKEDQYAFFPRASKRMQDTIRKEVIEMVLATDMKQHFALMGIFNSKLAQSCREHRPGAVGAGLAPPPPPAAPSTGAASATPATQPSGHDQLHHAPSLIRRDGPSAAKLGPGSGEHMASHVSSLRRTAMQMGSHGNSDGAQKLPPHLEHLPLPHVGSIRRGSFAVMRNGSATGQTGAAAVAAAAAAATAAAAAPAAAAAAATAPAHPEWDLETQMLTMKMALKCADLGHLTSSREVHMQWVARLEEELFRQGDQEKAQGLQLSPLMDRTKAGITRSQCGFFNVVAMPLFKSLAQVFPHCEDLTTNLTANLAYWKECEAKHA